MDKVIDGLFISDYATACKREALKENNITHIIIAAKYLKPLFPIVRCVTVTLQEIDYLQLPIDDYPTENIATYFEKCIEYSYFLIAIGLQTAQEEKVEPFQSIGITSLS